MREETGRVVSCADLDTTRIAITRPTAKNVHRAGTAQTHQTKHPLSVQLENTRMRMPKIAAKIAVLEPSKILLKKQNAKSVRKGNISTTRQVLSA